MMPAAEHRQVAGIGSPAVLPLDSVIGLADTGPAGASREPAGPVTALQIPAQRLRGTISPPPHTQRLPGGTVREQQVPGRRQRRQTPRRGSIKRAIPFQFSRPKLSTRRPGRTKPSRTKPIHSKPSSRRPRRTKSGCPKLSTRRPGRPKPRGRGGHCGTFGGYRTAAGTRAAAHNLSHRDSHHDLRAEHPGVHPVRATKKLVGTARFRATQEAVGQRLGAELRQRRRIHSNAGPRCSAGSKCSAGSRCSSGFSSNAGSSSKTGPRKIFELRGPCAGQPRITIESAIDRHSDLRGEERRERAHPVRLSPEPHAALTPGRVLAGRQAVRVQLFPQPPQTGTQFSRCPPAPVPRPRAPQRHRRKPFSLPVRERAGLVTNDPGMHLRNVAGLQGFKDLPKGRRQLRRIIKHPCSRAFRERTRR